MNDTHLTDEELDEVLIGGDLQPERADHLSACLACRARRAELVRVIEATRRPDPEQARLAAVRGRVLAGWERSQRSRGPARWWLAAAAALLLLALLPVLKGRRSQPAVAFNADKVLTEVDAVLDRDPLTSMTSEAVVDTVVPATSTPGTGGA
jgi:hypothetical protein